MTSLSQFSLLQSAYSKLRERFFRPAKPTPVGRPAMVLWNSALAEELGLNGNPSGISALLSWNDTLSGSTPLASVYAGHRFGHFVPKLGDGRAILLEEAMSRQGMRYEIQLKRAGRTPFSRNGHGRSSLGPVFASTSPARPCMRLGVPTSKAIELHQVLATPFDD